MQKNNKGFTLVELMIVVAMIAILGAVVATASSSLTSGRAREAATSYSALLDEARVLAVNGAGSGADDQQLILNLDVTADGLEAQIYSKNNKGETIFHRVTEFSSTVMPITVVQNAGGAGVVLKEGDSVKVAFTSTGRMVPMNTIYDNAGYSDSTLSEIIFGVPGSSYTLVFSFLTGTHELQ